LCSGNKILKYNWKIKIHSKKKAILKQCTKTRVLNGAKWNMGSIQKAIQNSSLMQFKNMLSSISHITLIKMSRI